MLAAVKGIVRGNTVIVENEDLCEYDGSEVVVTFLDKPNRKRMVDRAAQIRAVYKGFKGMDSLQLAAVCLKKCDLFLTNDKQLKQFEGIKCITMDDIEY